LSFVRIVGGKNVQRDRYVYWRIALMAAALVASPLSARADTPFAAYDGAWSGTGNVKLENGKTERLKCKGYYNAKAGGSGLSIAIDCGNPSFRINMRANLAYANGEVSGSWEEREFNQSGSVTGKATPSRLSLTFSGGVSGSMSISMGGSSQSVSISTGGPGFTGVNLQFAKSG
jgi:hypothetical protein